ncbi:MAG: hypothetical protein ACI9QD_000116 [Thermoproteota archaeon]|jgi:hypothetical protein
MARSVIVLLTFLISFGSYAVSFDERIYYLQDYVNNQLCFDIYNEEIESFIKEKKSLKEDKKVIGKICHKDKTTVKFKYDELNSVTEFKPLKQLYHNKIEYIFPEKFENILKNYKVKYNGKYYVAKSLLDTNVNEIYIFKKKGKPPSKLIYKRAIGTTTINIKWSKFSWSHRKFLPVELDIKKMEGTHFIISKVYLKYQNLVNSGIVKKITIFTSQKLSMEKGSKALSRRSKSIFHLDNFVFY